MLFRSRAYIFFSVEEIMEMLNCGRNKAVNCLKELDQEKGIGLIEKRRIGLGKTNVIYVKNFSLTEYPDEPAIFDSEKTLENDIQTYKEIVAFCEGKKLDELHKAVEAGKRPYQNILKVFAGAGVAALVCILIGFFMHIFLN